MTIPIAYMHKELRSHTNLDPKNCVESQARLVALIAKHIVGRVNKQHGESGPGLIDCPCRHIPAAGDSFKNAKNIGIGDPPRPCLFVALRL